MAQTHVSATLDRSPSGLKMRQRSWIADRRELAGQLRWLSMVMKKKRSKLRRFDCHDWVRERIDEREVPRNGQIGEIAYCHLDPGAAGLGA